MTLIVGVNTSSGIYLASDTRITIGPPGGPYTHRNDLQKTVPFNRSIVVAAAGSVAMARHLSAALACDPSCKSEDIRALRRHAIDVVRVAGDEYFRHYPDDPRPHCALLIAGLGSRFGKPARARGRIPGILDAAERFRAAAVEQVVKQLESATSQGDRGRLLNMLAEYAASGLRPNAASGSVLATALLGTEEDGVTMLPCRDSHLFSLEVGPYTLRCQDAEWGEGLVFGGDESIRKDVAPDDLVAAIEFSELITAPPHLVISILQTARDHGATTIGGGVQVTLIRDQGLGYWNGWVKKLSPDSGATEDLSEIVVSGDELSIREDGRLMKLVPFPRWPIDPAGTSARA